LRRLFSFAFNRPISGYIRSRALSESLNDLLNTDKNISDIALEYGFDYENSYSRSFKREFGISPDNLRKSKQIVKIQPPLHLFDENKLDDNALFGPEFVIVPLDKSQRIRVKYLKCYEVYFKEITCDFVNNCCFGSNLFVYYRRNNYEQAFNL